MKLLLSISTFILLINACKNQKTRFSVACGRFQDNEKLFFGNCTLNEGGYDRIIEFTNYILSSDPKLNLDDFLRNYLTVNATQYFRKTFPNASYIEKLDLFVSELSTVMKKLESSLSKVGVSEFFDAAKTSNFSQVLIHLIQQRDNLVLTDWDKYQEMYCNQGIISFCKSAQTLLNVTYVDDIPMTTVLELLQYIFERAYEKINSILLLPDKSFIMEKLKKIDSQGTLGTVLYEVHEIINTKLFNYTIEYFAGNSPIFTSKKSTTTTTLRKTTTKKEKVLEIEAVTEAVYLSVPLAILFVTIVITIGLIILNQNFLTKSVQPKQNEKVVLNLDEINRPTKF